MLGNLTLRMKYDDGFAAYVNGTEIARANAPAQMEWNSRATVLHNDSEAVHFEDFPALQAATLVEGTNILAIHGLNDRINSSDFLMLPELDATLGGTILTNEMRYFTQPSPGAPNDAGVTNFGAVIRAAGHNPAVPGDNDNLTITARVSDVRSGIASVVLHYRIMFDNEIATPMFDDGAHGDGAAGDGIYGASIPAAASSVGQMIRYYIVATNNAGAGSRWPLPQASEQYLGTIVADPSVQTNVPAYHFFVPPASVNRIETDIGTTCCLFYNGEFYDNVLVQRRGGWTSTQPFFKKYSHQFKFPKGHALKYRPGVPRADNVNVNSAYNDQSYFREYLCWESYREAGAPGSTSFHVELRLNGAFYCLGVFVEQPDDDFLERNGYDERGALYKGQNNN
jgi:hypothetical protein